MKEQQIKQLKAKIASYKRYATEEKKAAESNKDCFLAWQSHDQKYCFWLGEIDKLEKELELVKAGWGSITA